MKTILNSKSQNHFLNLLADKHLCDAFICLETDIHQKSEAEFDGVDIAIKELQKNPQGRIILTSMMSVKEVSKFKPEINFLLSKENVRFIDTLADQSHFENIWNTPSEYSGNILAISDYTQKIMGYLAHAYKGPQDTSRVADQAREHFPSMQNLAHADVIDFILTSVADRPLVRDGEYCDGVFCDIEGTLFVDNILQKKVLDRLEEYKREGKVVSLWTDGDVKSLSGLLEDNNIQFPLFPKLSFAGAVVEIAIDDMDELAFNARTKIFAKNFISVREL